MPFYAPGLLLSALALLAGSSEKMLAIQIYSARAINIHAIQFASRRSVWCRMSTATIGVSIVERYSQNGCLKIYAEAA